MIVGIGSDLCNIERIQNSLDRWGDKFLNRVFTKTERNKAASRPHTRAGTLAKRFAAKEAFSKALGTGIHFPVNWHNVWVENARSGKPSLKFSRVLAALLKRRGIENVYVSLTDEIGMACAFVVVEGGTPKARRKT